MYSGKDGAASVIRTRDLTLTKGEVEGYRYLKINIIFRLRFTGVPSLCQSL